MEIKADVVEVTFINGYLSVHRFHPDTGEDANTPSPDFSAKDMATFERLRSEGEIFVWLDSGGTQIRALMSQLVAIALESGMSGVSVCHCNHAADAERPALH